MHKQVIRAGEAGVAGVTGVGGAMIGGRFDCAEKERRCTSGGPRLVMGDLGGA